MNEARILFYISLIFLSLLYGCVKLMGVTSEAVSRIEINRSTKENVLEILGNPGTKEIKSYENKNREFWTYLKPIIPISDYNITGWTYHGSYSTYSESLQRNESARLKDDSMNNRLAIIEFDEKGLVVGITNCFQTKSYPCPRVLK